MGEYMMGALQHLSNIEQISDMPPRTMEAIRHLLGIHVMEHGCKGGVRVCSWF